MVQLSLYTFVSLSLSAVGQVCQDPLVFLIITSSMSHCSLVTCMGWLISGKVCNASSGVVVYPCSPLLFYFRSQEKHQKEMGELGLPGNKAI